MVGHVGLTNSRSSGHGHGHVTYKFWEIIDINSEIVQDRDIVTTQD